MAPLVKDAGLVETGYVETRSSVNQGKYKKQRATNETKECDKKVLVSLLEGEAHPLAEDLQQSYTKPSILVP
jgi:hypothetical protein